MEQLMTILVIGFWGLAVIVDGIYIFRIIRFNRALKEERKMNRLIMASSLGRYSSLSEL